MTLPPPLTFAEGQRYRMVNMMALAGIITILAAVALTGILVFGPFTAATESLRLYILAGALAGFLTATLGVIFALTVGGPVGSYRVEVNKDGLNLNLLEDPENDSRASP